MTDFRLALTLEAMKFKDARSLKESYDSSRQCIKKVDITLLTNNLPIVQAWFVVMYECELIDGKG